MKIGLIGTGLMGEPMALRLLSAQQSLVVWNRTASKLETLQKAGAEIADSPDALIAACNCIILMLTDATAIQTVLFSDASRQQLSNRTVIQMGTITPSDSQDIYSAVVAAGGDYLEAPVLGSIPQVKSGELLVMVGGTEAQFQQWLHLLKQFGPEPRLIGPVGKAAALKLAFNQLIASLMTSFALSLAFVQKQGVAVEDFMKILRQSALYAPTFDKKLQPMLSGNYANANFPTKHLLKDTNFFLREAESIQLNVSSLEGVRAVLEKAQQLGLTDADYSSLFEAIKGGEMGQT